MKTILLAILSNLISVCFSQNTVTDNSGNVYKTVKIGNQIWMAQNLNTDRFRNGDLIPEAKSSKAWASACENYQPAWCYYNNDPLNASKHGKLYNFWAVIDARGIAPNEWKIPKQEDFQILKESIGSYKLNEIDLGAKPIYKNEVSYLKIPSHKEEKYVSCKNCSYWTNEQKKYNPCTKCKNKGYYYVKTGKIIPAKIEKIEKKILINGFENGQDKFGFNMQTSGKRVSDKFSEKNDLKTAYLWTADFNDSYDIFGVALNIGDQTSIDRSIYSGYPIRSLMGDNPLASSLDIKDIKDIKSFDFATISKQYQGYYPDYKIQNIDKNIKEILNSEAELNFISIKTEYACTGNLDYIYNGIDGKNDIIGYKITKQNDGNSTKLFLNFLTASTSKYNKVITNYGPVELVKISDLYYKTTDNQYKVIFQYTQMNCESTEDPENNLHLKVIGEFNKGIEKSLYAYQLNWIEQIGGAHWSYNGGSMSGHSQNWAIEKVFEFLNVSK